MPKLLHICAGCGHDRVAWECWNCGSTKSRKASEAVMRQVRRDYAKRLLDTAFAEDGSLPGYQVNEKSEIRLDGSGE